MLSVGLLLLTILSAYVVVIVGATAFELTGLDRDTAHFQALSAFTGTGFTTRQSERAINTPIRRRITIALIVLGYAGTATVVASLVTSVNAESTLLSLRNIVVLLFAGGLAWWGLTRLGSFDWIVRYVRKRIPKGYLEDSLILEELLHYRRGFGVVRVEIPSDSRLIGKTLRELHLPEQSLTVLAIEDDLRVMPVVDPDWSFVAHAHVIVYGRVANVADVFAPGVHIEE